MVTVLAAQISERGIAGDLREPRPQAVRLAKIVKLAPGGEECFLPGIFARGEIPQNAKRNATNHGLMPRDYFHECALVAAAHSMDQFSIRRASFRRCRRSLFSPMHHVHNPNITILILDAASRGSVTLASKIRAGQKCGGE